MSRYDIALGRKKPKPKKMKLESTPRTGKNELYEKWVAATSEPLPLRGRNAIAVTIDDDWAPVPRDRWSDVPVTREVGRVRPIERRTRRLG